MAPKRLSVSILLSCSLVECVGEKMSGEDLAVAPDALGTCSELTPSAVSAAGSSCQTMRSLKACRARPPLLGDRATACFVLG
jgi:hypothetical protein